MAESLNRKYPYPRPTGDGADVAYWMQRLAEALDVDVQELAAIQALQGRGAIGRDTKTVNVAGVGTEKKLLNEIRTISLKAGRTYRITAKGNMYANAPTTAFALMLSRSSTDPSLVGSTTGTSIDTQVWWTPSIVDASVSYSMISFYIPAADETVRLFVTGVRAAGSGTGMFYAGATEARTLFIEDAGVM